MVVLDLLGVVEEELQVVADLVVVIVVDRVAVEVDSVEVEVVHLEAVGRVVDLVDLAVLLEEVLIFYFSGKITYILLGSRGGSRGGLGSRGGARVIVEPHRHEGVFVARGKEDLLVTRNMTPGESVYNEKRISVENPDSSKVEYRVWNPFRSKLAAGILGGVEHIHIAPGKRVLYLGAASGTTVSHVSDVVGPSGLVYAVEFSHRSGRDLIGVAKKRTNIIPIIEDARHPQRYRMLVGMVDVIFADVAQPDQARIIALNAHHFLKAGGHIVISIKANCIDSTVDASTVFSREVKKLQEERIKPQEQITLEPYERDHALVVGIYRPTSKKAASK